MDEAAKNILETLKVWRETAQQLSKLATASLLLPTFFLRDILGVPEHAPLWENLNGWLIAAWGLFLLAILVDAGYQVTSARIIGDLYQQTFSAPLYPQLQFRLLVGSLWFGLVFFLIGIQTSGRGGDAAGASATTRAEHPVLQPAPRQ